jgi:glycosyltransferase involved in cell wall biosynthesis
LLCSHQEGFSNAVLESMAAGLPAIVTDVGGNAEAVVDGETGLVVPPHAPARLAEAIVRLANDPALCAELGAAARQRVAKHFSFKQCVSHYDGLYRMLATDATVRRLESHVGNRAQAFEQSPADRVLDERNVLWSPNFGRKVA